MLKELHHRLLQGFRRLSLLLPASLVSQKQVFSLPMCGWNGQLEELGLQRRFSHPLEVSFKAQVSILPTFPQGHADPWCVRVHGVCVCARVHECTWCVNACVHVRGV